MSHSTSIFTEKHILVLTQYRPSGTFQLGRPQLRFSKKYSYYHFSMYIHLYRKVDLLLRTEKCYLSLAVMNLRNCLFIIYVYSKLSKKSYLSNIHRGLSGIAHTGSLALYSIRKMVEGC